MRKKIPNYIMIAPKKLRGHPSNEKYFGSNNSRYYELSESIRTNGFLAQYPVTCIKEGSNSYVIICGHRRWKIACEQNIPEIPVIVRNDIAADSADAEKLMIEDNLHRPRQWRTFSPIERYMFAMQIDFLCEDKRGGDRRSEKFKSKQEQSRKEKKNEHIAAMVGMSPRYLSMLSVVTKNILKELAKVSPDMFEGHNIYDQIKIALDNNLSPELTALYRSEMKLHMVYRTFKKTNQTLSTSSDSNTPSTPTERNNDNILYRNATTALIRFFESAFDDRGVFSEAAGMLLETPLNEHTKQLALLSKALSSVTRKIKTLPKKKRLLEPELFSLEGGIK